MPRGRSAAQRGRQRYGHITDANQLTRSVAVNGADVDVHRLHLRHLLAVVGVEQVDRLLANHPHHNAFARSDSYALANQHLRVPATDAGEAQEARVLDVRDD